MVIIYLRLMYIGPKRRTREMARRHQRTKQARFALARLAGEAGTVPRGRPRCRSCRGCNSRQCRNLCIGRIARTAARPAGRHSLRQWTPGRARIDTPRRRSRPAKNGLMLASRGRGQHAVIAAAGERLSSERRVDGAQSRADIPLIALDTNIDEPRRSRSF